jgi:hypothetical protein
MRSCIRRNAPGAVDLDDAVGAWSGAVIKIGHGSTDEAWRAATESGVEEP